MFGYCFPKNKVTILPKSSLIKHYEILILPIFLMIPFGCFGFKPGQFAKGIVAYFINFLCIIYLVLFSFLTMHFVFEPKHIVIEAQVRVAFIYFFTLANFVLLLFKFYRKYNLYCLLEDIVEIRQICLSKIETFQVFVLFIFCLTFIVVLLYTNCLMYLTKMPNFWTLITNDTEVVKILGIIHPVIAVTVQWVSLSCSSLIISVICVILSAEFTQCNTDLMKEIDKENHLTYVTFCNITKRFYKLKEVVYKLDAMFSDLVALHLAVAFVILCFATFFLISGNHQIYWTTPWMSALLILILIMPQAVTLHDKVSTSSTLGENSELGYNPIH